MCYVDGRADPSGASRMASVGTTLEVVDFAHVQDGRIFVTSKGRERFRVLSIVKDRPIMIAEVEELPEDEVEGEEVASLAEEVADLLRSTIRLNVKLNNLEASEDQVGLGRSEGWRAGEEGRVGLCLCAGVSVCLCFCALVCLCVCVSVCLYVIQEGPAGRWPYFVGTGDVYRSASYPIIRLSLSIMVNFFISCSHPTPHPSPLRGGPGVPLSRQRPLPDVVQGFDISLDYHHPMPIRSLSGLSVGSSILSVYPYLVRVDAASSLTPLNLAP
ncbi:hypothetical protein Vafri_16436 [Volvox africanus]|uniref:Lon N-terminal domain-containing protein n=1 Tax=Volvox africanus TaxID=51714 RepID=A0A8J4F6H0_9CHLO|nr:hypothetical protein Vafri_16436 [Volvox africanus]